MSIRIGSNIAALQAQRHLGKTSDSLNQIYTRLSSGMRINRASDDAAGLAIAGSLNADIRIYSQAIRNLNDGISALSIADGALNNLSNVVTRLKELTFQASNGVYGFSQRSSLNSEALALVKEFNRITGSTTFNGRKLIDGTMRELSLQAGRGDGSTLGIGIGSGLGRYVGTGVVANSTALSFTSGAGTNEISMVDLDGDGNLDMVHGGTTNATTGLYVRMGNGDGTFGNSVGYSAFFANRFVVADVNGDGHLDAIGYGNVGGNVGISLGNGDGSFADRILLDGIAANSISTLAVGDFNNDGKADIAVTIGGSGILGVYNGNGNGYFQSGVAIASGTITSNSNINVADLNHDGIDDIVVNNDTAGYISTLIGGSSGISRSQEFRLTTSSSTNVRLGDINGDGKIDLIASYQDASNDLFIALGNGDGTFGSARSMAADIEYDGLTLGDVNSDGILDLLTTDYATGSFKIFLGNGDGSFRLNSTASLGAGQNIRTATIADIDNDGSMEVIVGRNAGGAFLVNQVDEYSTRLEQLNLNTQELALSSLGYLEAAQRRIDKERSLLGGYMSRLNFATSNLLSARNEFSAALSRITDVDVAEESASLVAKKIAQDVGSAILAQANLQPSLVLRLLQN